MSREALVESLRDLTGQEPPLPLPRDIQVFAPAGSVLGYSQLNELLLLSGYDRVDDSFFQYLATGQTTYESGTAIRTIEDLRTGVERFRILALLLFGNVKFAFKTLSRDAEELLASLSFTLPRSEDSFVQRHEPVWPVQQIAGEDTYYLGYVIEQEIRNKLVANPADALALAQEARRQAIVGSGIRNHQAYLASDHLDVYVATSMRQRHEFLVVHELTQQIFDQPQLRRLKPRWFDPTQAYCGDRIDKGLAEGLMLKRAKCTLYFVQESDTFGKDSELACTLAQGKPVIAFVPDPARRDVERVLTGLKESYPGYDEARIVLEQLRVANPSLAWTDGEVRGWSATPAAMDIAAGKERLFREVKAQYDRRALMLKEKHPLGVQVHLSTGVANGVLVVRSVEDCAEVIAGVLTNTLEFYIEETSRAGERYLFLREKRSDCVFRVMSGDKMLTNAFWNFYLTGPQPA